MPVPVGVALRLEPHGGGLALYDGKTLVAEAGPTQLPGGAPERFVGRAPTVAEASAASTAYPGLTRSPFPRCVVCGTERSDPDAFRIFPGPLADRELLAAVWHPTAGSRVGEVIRPEYAWAALDCPAGWAAVGFGQVHAPAVLGRMAAWLSEPMSATGEYVVVGWLEGVSGRKLYAGSALYSPSGVLQGFSRQTWITIPAAVVAG